MLRFIKNMFAGVLTSVVNTFYHTKCVTLNNQKCITQPTLFSLHPSKYNQKLFYYPFVINLDKCLNVLEVAILFIS